MLRRKWLNATVMFALLFVLAACSVGGNGFEPEGEQQGNASTTSPQETNVTKPKLKVLYPNQPEDYNTYPVAAVLEERTGYKVQYDMLPADNPQDKLNIVIASGEDYDAIAVRGTSADKALFADYAVRGALTDLTPLIDEFGPNIKKAISQVTLDALTIDGKIYGIGNRTIEFVGGGLLIRQDWLDKLGLPLPTTVEEFVQVLEQFQLQDPGSNGSNNIPFSILGTDPFPANISGAFALTNAWNEVDGKLLPRALAPTLDDYVVFMNDLFQRKLLDNDFVVNKVANLKEKLTNGQAGVIPTSWAEVPPLLEAIQKRNPAAKLSFIPALKGPDGHMGLSAASGFDRITMIPKSAKNKEEIIKWIDAMLEEETFKLVAIGEESKHYTYDHGVYKPINPIFTDERNRANNFLIGLDEENYPTYWQARVHKDPVLFEAYEFLNMKQPEGVALRDELRLAPYLPEFSKNSQSLDTLSNDYMVKLIFGSEAVNKLHSFQQRFNAEGGEVTVSEVNDWYETIGK